MKNKILIAAAAAAAGAAFVSYLLKRIKTAAIETPSGAQPAKRSHHLTRVFAQAKNYQGEV